MWFLIVLVVILGLMIAIGGVSEYSRRKTGEGSAKDVSQRIEHKIDSRQAIPGKQKKKDDDDPMSQFDHLFEEQEDLWAKYDKKR